VRYARKKVEEYGEAVLPEDVEYAVGIQIAHAISGGSGLSSERVLN
jgi:hypothetical protein